MFTGKISLAIDSLISRHFSGNRCQYRQARPAVAGVQKGGAL
jgi:hypothetical protein